MYRTWEKRGKEDDQKSEHPTLVNPSGTILSANQSSPYVLHNLYETFGPLVLSIALLQCSRFYYIARYKPGKISTLLMLTLWYMDNKCASFGIEFLSIIIKKYCFFRAPDFFSVCLSACSPLCLNWYLSTCRNYSRGATPLCWRLFSSRRQLNCGFFIPYMFITSFL